MTNQPERDSAGALDVLDCVEPVDSATAFATRFREVAAAVLIQVCMDETAAPHARVMAARAVLSYSDGRPGQARPLAVCDLSTLSYNDRLRVLIQLLGDPELAHILPRAIAEAAATPPTTPALAAPVPAAVPVKMIRRSPPGGINGHASAPRRQRVALISQPRLRPWPEALTMSGPSPMRSTHPLPARQGRPWCTKRPMSCLRRSGRANRAPCAPPRARRACC